MCFFIPNLLEFFSAKNIAILARKFKLFNKLATAQNNIDSILGAKIQTFQQLSNAEKQHKLNFLSAKIQIFFKHFKVEDNIKSS